MYSDGCASPVKFLTRFLHLSQVLEPFIGNQYFDLYQSYRAFPYYWRQWNFGLIDNCYHDNYRNRNSSIHQPPLSHPYNRHDYYNYTLTI
jgi:hypothetical protein